MTAKQKRELLALPVDPAPTIKVEPVTYHEEKDCYSGKTFQREHWHFLYGAVLHGDILAFTLYRADGTPLFRTFQAADSLVSQYLDEDPYKSSESTLETYSWNRWQCRHYIEFHTTPEVDTLIFKQLTHISPLWLSPDKKTESGFGFVKLYQRRIREYDVKQRYDRIRAETDNEMLEIRPLPQKVKDWVDSTVMKEHRYIFYDYRKGAKKMNGWCTHCGATVQVVGAHHQQPGQCPACHSAVTLLAKGKYANDYAFRNEENFAYFQSTKAGWCVRTFEVYIRFYPSRKEKSSLRYDYCEKGRYFFRREDRNHPDKSFYWENFKNTGEMRFCRVGGLPYGGNSFVYPGTLDTLLRPGDPYTPYRELAKKCGELNPFKLTTTPPGMPAVEYLYKLGLYRLCADVINNGRAGCIDPLGKTFQAKMGLAKSELPQLRELNPDEQEYILFRQIRQGGRSVSNEDFRWLCSLNRQQSLVRILTYQSPESARHYISRQLKERMAKPVEDPKCSCSYNYHPERETVAERQKREMNNILSDWNDYLQECEQLEYDMANTRILRPTDLGAAHEQTSALMRAQRDALEKKRAVKQAVKEKREIAVLAKELDKKYSYEADGLLIRALASRAEVKAEGEALEHCVGGYTDLYAKGSTYLFCVRRTEDPDKPYYTLELSPSKGTITQYRGYRNDSKRNGVPDGEVTAFVNKWMTHVVNRINKKDVQKATA